MVSKFLITLGLTLDIVGVLLLSAALISGRKREILRHLKWLKHNEEMRAESVEHYERMRREHYQHTKENPDIEYANPPEWFDGKIDEWIADVDASRGKASGRLSDTLGKLRTELESYQARKEWIGVILLVIGFLFQIAGTLRA